MSALYLEAVGLRHFGCHEHFAVDLQPGLNLVSGPNGVGKSTLFQAIWIALAEKHTSNNQRVRDWLPWGSDGLGPTVELKVVRGGGRFALTKRYIHQPDCMIVRLDGPERYSGRPAEEILDNWLRGDGVAGLLMRALWCDHDAVTLFDAARISRDRKASLSSVVQPLLESNAANPAPGPFARIREAAERAYAERITPDRQQIRKPSTLRDATQRRDDAIRQLQELNSQAASLERALDRLASCADRHREAEAARTHAREAVETLRRQVESYREAASAVAAAERAFSDAQRRLDELEEAETKLQEAIRDENAAQAALERARVAADQAREQYEQAQAELEAAQDRRGRIEEYLSAIEQAISRRDPLEAADQAVQTQSRLLCAAEQDVEAASRRLDAAASAVASARANLARLRTLAEAHQRARELEVTRARLNDINTVEAEIARLEAAVANHPVPADTQLQQLRKRVRELWTLDHALDDQPVSLRIAPERPIEIRVRDDDAERTARIEPESPGDFELREQLTLEVPGLGRVELRRVGAKAEERRARRRTLANQLNASWTEYGVGGLDELEQRLEWRRRLDQLRLGLKAQLGGESIEAIRARSAELEQHVAADGPLSDPAPETSELAQAERMVAVTDAALRQAERESIAATERRRQKHEELENATRTLEERAGGDPDAARGELRSQIDAAIEAIHGLGVKLEAPTRNAVIACRRSLQDELGQLAEARDRASSAWNEARQALAEASTQHRLRRERLDERQRAAPGDEASRRQAIDNARLEAAGTKQAYEKLQAARGPDPAAALAEAERQLAEAENAAKTADMAHRAAERELAALQGPDFERRRARAEEEHAAAEAAYQREVREAAAWALLHLLCKQAEAEVTRSVSARLAELAGPRVGRLTRGHVEALELNDDGLEPIRARGRQLAGLFGVDRFSRGTREQISLGCRLALGELLASQGRQMLLLDEPLAHTDPDRQRAALDLLVELAERLQILIFTCHPDRYAAILRRPGVGAVALGTTGSAPGG